MSDSDSGSRTTPDDLFDKAGPEDLRPGRTIVDGLQTYGPFIVVGWCAFELARRYYAQAYYVRERSPETASPTTVMARRAGIFGWLWPIYTTSDDVVFQTCGMDTLFLLRFMRMCQKIAWLGILMSGALFPVYYYGHAEGSTDAMFKMTLSHLDIDKGDGWRFTLTVVSMYLVSICTCYLLWNEFSVYVRRRHEFLSRKASQQYTIVINGLPDHLCTQQTLRNYMEVLFPKSVLYVYVAVECGDLEKLVAERVKVRNRLEHALALGAKKGERVMKRDKMFGEKNVDAIELYQDQLRNLNDAVEMEVRSILRNQAALASQMLEASLVDDEESDVPTLQTQRQNVIIVDEGRSAESAYIKGLRKRTKGVENTSIMRGAGFVTFNTLGAAQSAQQVLQASDLTEMRIEAAPHVDDVVWENLGISFNVKSYWGFISTAATTAIILFWTIPTAFVVTISKVEKLKTELKWLGRFADKNPWIEPVLQQISPLMLSIMNALAPIIFGILSKREGHASGADVQNSLLNKLVAYQWFMVFLLPILGGTFLDSLLGKSEDNQLKDPTKLVQTISEAIPAQSSFFISYLMVQMGLPTSLQLLRVPPIVKAHIYRVFAPKLTPRQRSSAWFGLAPLTMPGDIGVTDPIAQYYLVLILILVFAPVAPILCYFAAAYLFLSELVFRWSALCVHDPSPYRGAIYFPTLYRFCMGALLFSQIVMATVLGLKRTALAATFAIILPITTVLFHLIAWKRFPRAALNLPLDECVMLDKRRHRQLDDLEKVLEDVYRQPAMAERHPIDPDYPNLASNPDGANQLSSPVKEYPDKEYC
ncbi:hypothetical protein Poli38472_000983 [Pythium oligandrum]|uniref:DUF221-domain-containing protein n=1 Tax=Pythium oligandrum TaxID=41045 RepID=A0A8K1CDL8_PYTOL|nr:hypothetical protein Poli38472_000983 [Pythium oligandrum]|eukprot:TMW60941.1 hypothetical protein Poli38472_000983 [Pythium oligandrum]